MNILVCIHHMEIGGSQLNALELAAAVQDRGHNVTVIGPEGVLSPMVSELGLRFIRAVAATEYPSPRTTFQFMQLVRALNIDIVHAYEWRPALEATFGPHLFGRVPVLITVLSMIVPKFLPTHIPIVVGTQELKEQLGTRDVYLLEPPVDTKRNCAMNVSAARAQWSFDDSDIVVSVVCRLTPDLEKLDGVLQAIDAVSRLATELPVKLLIVGGGSGLTTVEQRAAAANLRLGRKAIHVTGPMLDPRGAYEAADIVIGMGGSVLRGMAFAKPVIVQGTSGFWQVLDESTLDMFLTQGWFGDGGQGVDDLVSCLTRLAADPIQRVGLGGFGRRIVVERFSLDHAADQLVSIYHRTASKRLSRLAWVRSMARSAARVAKFRLAMALKRLPVSIRRPA